MKRYKVHEELCLISQIEPKFSYESCKADHWIQSIKEEPDRIIKSKTWEWISRPKDNNVIGIKCVFKKMMNE